MPTIDGPYAAARCLFLAGALTVSSAAGAQELRLAIISEGTNTWPLYVADAKKLYEREGIKVATTLTGSSARQLAELNKGGFDIGFQQSDHIVRGVEQGAELVIVMAQAHAPELSLVVTPDIGSFQDLKGKVVAVDGARSGYALLLRKLLADKGLMTADYTLTEFGGSQERFDALASRKASASFLNPPFDRRLFEMGNRSLGSTSEYFPTYPGSIAAVRRSWAQANETQLVAFIRAFNAAYDWLQDKNNRAEAIAILPARLKIEPPAAGRAFDQLAAKPRPQITPDGVRQVIDIVWDAEGYTKAKAAPDKYMDLGYLQKAQAPR